MTGGVFFDPSVEGGKVGLGLVRLAYVSHGDPGKRVLCYDGGGRVLYDCVTCGWGFGSFRFGWGGDGGGFWVGCQVKLWFWVSWVLQYVGLGG